MLSELVVEPNGVLIAGSARYACALGRGGVILDKREGDGATPIGSFPLRHLFYRPDRMTVPASALPMSALTPHDGWCDDPTHPAYNTFVTLPFGARHEELWRDDALYDLICVIGYNDAPVVPRKGSAIFMHIAKPDYAPTEGCVALKPSDLHEVLSRCDAATMIRILEP